MGYTVKEQLKRYEYLVVLEQESICTVRKVVLKLTKDRLKT